MVGSLFTSGRLSIFKSLEKKIRKKLGPVARAKRREVTDDKFAGVMAFLAVFSAILAVVASQPEPGPVYTEPEPPVYDLPEPPPVKDSPPVYTPEPFPSPAPGYGPVDEWGYDTSPLRKLRENVLFRIQEMKSKIASVMEFRDVTLVSIEKISSLTAAWCRSKYPRSTDGYLFCCVICLGKTCC